MNSNETAHNPLDGITATLEKALQQAREQADVIINDARAEAEQIVADARAEAEQIIADAGAQANTRARADMERASLAIQEHAAALHTLALGLAGHATTPRDNTDNASGSADDDSANSSASDTDSSITNENTNNSNANANNSDAIPPAPTVATPRTTNDSSAPTTAIHTTRRANGTTRKLAPWEQPQDTPTLEPEETHANDTNATTERNNEPERAATTGDTTAPQWDAPLVIDAPLQL